MNIVKPNSRLKMMYEGEFEVDEEFQQDLDDCEQDLEDEANEMMSAWNREDLLREVAEEKERIKLDQEFKSIEYYDGETEFEKIASDMKTVGGGGVLLKVLKSCPDGKPVVAASTILMDRVGFMEFELSAFDSTIYDGKPAQINLMDGPILPGMLQALINLREGETACIIIRPEMAYGKIGSLPLVPPDADLLYYVKIHKVWDVSYLTELLEVEDAEGIQIPMEDKLKFVGEHKEIANKLLRDDRPTEALVRYKAAIKCLDDMSDQALMSSKELRTIMTILLQNTAITQNKLGYHKSATATAKRALLLDPTNLKAFYQLVQARIKLSDYSGAQRWLAKVNKQWPSHPSLDKLRLELDFKCRDEKSKRDEIMKKMAGVFK